LNFFEASVSKIGREALGNCLTNIFNELEFDQQTLNDDQIRQRLKATFFNKWQRNFKCKAAL